VHRHAVPGTDVAVLGQRLPLHLAKRSPRRRQLGRCRNSSKGAVGVSSNLASTGSSFRGRAGLSERPLTPMGCQPAVPVAHLAKLRADVEPDREPCVRISSGIVLRAGVWPPVSGSRSARRQDWCRDRGSSAATPAVSGPTPRLLSLCLRRSGSRLAPLTQGAPATGVLHRPGRRATVATVTGAAGRVPLGSVAVTVEVRRECSV
jgi:hypothetical protein